MYVYACVCMLFLNFLICSRLCDWLLVCGLLYTPLAASVNVMALGVNVFLFGCLLSKCWNDAIETLAYTQIYCLEFFVC